MTRGLLARSTETTHRNKVGVTKVDLNGFSLSEFIRYILTGFNFLLFVIGLPLFWLVPTTTKDWILGTSFVFGLLLCISVGYLFDILKIYQFTPKFKKNRTEFRENIAHILGVSIEEASSYFSLVSKLWGAYSPYDLERRRSEWVLTLNASVTLMISVAVWAIIGITVFIANGFYLGLIIPVLAVASSIIIVARLLKIADRERQKSNRDIYLILEHNKDAILGGWSLQTQIDLEKAEHKGIKDGTRSGTQHPE